MCVFVCVTGREACKPLCYKGRVQGLLSGQFLFIYLFCHLMKILKEHTVAKARVKIRLLIFAIFLQSLGEGRRRFKLKNT